MDVGLVRNVKMGHTWCYGARIECGCKDSLRIEAREPVFRLQEQVSGNVGFKAGANRNAFEGAVVRAFWQIERRLRVARECIGQGIRIDEVTNPAAYGPFVVQVERKCKRRRAQKANLAVDGSEIVIGEDAGHEARRKLLVIANLNGAEAADSADAVRFS